MHDDDGDKTDEIEVTPAMIEAGAGVIYARFGDVLTRPSETALDVAAEVFRAMRMTCRPPDRTR